MPTRDLTIPATDGYGLAATLYEPDISNERCILLNSAMAVKRGFYSKYAAYLAGQGFIVLTYDYRGIGGSRPASLRGFEAHLWEWGAKDCSGALAWLDAQYPAQKILAVGHSVGGQVIGLAPNNTRLSGWLGVAVQSAYWRLWPGVSKWRMFLLWHLALPVPTRLLGYFPGWLGVGGDLPAGIALDWARGGRHRKYLLDLYGGGEHDHYAHYTAPVCDYSFSDDSYAPRAAVDELLTFYPNAPKTHKHVHPADVGLKTVGHFGFFRKAAEPTLWPESAAWLAAQQCVSC
jgi:predicted alpha/beta hydrolase